MVVYDRTRLDMYMALNRVWGVYDRSPVSKASLCGFLDVPIPMLCFAFHNNGNTEYARPNQLELVLSPIEAVSQPNAPDNIAVL